MNSTPQPTTPEPSTFTANFVLRPAAPGTPETITATEPTAKLAYNIGLIKAIQQAGWIAFVYGSVEVRHLQTGKTWTVGVTVGGAK